jgi:hypothetical protein
VTSRAWIWLVAAVCALTALRRALSSARKALLRASLALQGVLGDRLISQSQWLTATGETHWPGEQRPYSRACP